MLKINQFPIPRLVILKSSAQNKLVIPPPISSLEMRSLCDNLGGVLPTPMTPADLEADHAKVRDVYLGLGSSERLRTGCFVKKTAGERVTFWTGIGYSAERAAWVNTYTNESVPYMNNHSSPAGGGGGHHPLLVDQACSYVWLDFLGRRQCDVATSCGYCVLRPRSAVRLKGLCRQVVDGLREYDAYYYVRGFRNGRYGFSCVRVVLGWFGCASSLSTSVYSLPPGYRFRLDFCASPYSSAVESMLLYLRPFLH